MGSPNTDFTVAVDPSVSPIFCSSSAAFIASSALQNTVPALLILERRTVPGRRYGSSSIALPCVPALELRLGLATSTEFDYRSHSHQSVDLVVRKRQDTARSM